MPFVGGPNTRKTNPRWRKAAILKNRKSAISPSAKVRPIGTKFGLVAHIGPPNRTGSKISTFQNPRWQTAAIMKNRKTVISQQRLMQSTQNLAR